MNHTLPEASRSPFLLKRKAVQWPDPVIILVDGEMDGQEGNSRIFPVNASGKSCASMNGSINERFIVALISDTARSLTIYRLLDRQTGKAAKPERASQHDTLLSEKFTECMCERRARTPSQEAR